MENQEPEAVQDKGFPVKIKRRSIILSFVFSIVSFILVFAIIFTFLIFLLLK